MDWFIPSRLRDDSQTLRRARVLVGTAFGLTLAFASGTAVRMAIGNVHTAAIVVAWASTAVVVAAPFVLRASGSLKLAGAVILVDYTASIVVMGALAGGLDSPMMMAAPLAPLIAVSLIDVRAAIATAITLSVVVAVFLIPSFQDGSGPEDRQEVLARALVLWVSTLLVTFIAAWHDRQRSEVERRMRESEELYRWIFEQTKDAVALSTPDGRQVDVNQAGVDLYGFDSKAELLERDAGEGPRKGLRALRAARPAGEWHRHRADHRQAGGRGPWRTGVDRVGRGRHGDDLLLYSSRRRRRRQRTTP